MTAVRQTAEMTGTFRPNPSFERNRREREKQSDVGNARPVTYSMGKPWVRRLVFVGGLAPDPVRDEKVWTREHTIWSRHPEHLPLPVSARD